MGFCCNRLYESAYKIWTSEVGSFARSWDNRGYLKTSGSPWIHPCSLFSKFFCNAIFGVMISCSNPEIFAIKLRRRPKSCLNSDISGRQFIGGKGNPNFYPNFINYSHHRTCDKVWWRLAKRPPRLGGEKRSKHLEQYYNGRRSASWRAAIIKREMLTISQRNLQPIFHSKLGAYVPNLVIIDSFSNKLQQKDRWTQVRRPEHSRRQSLI